MRFNEAKAAQAAARLLFLRGGRMSYMKLIKLLYLADREALARWGRPISTDRYVSMTRGPVLSRTLDLITEGSRPGVVSVWCELISDQECKEVALKVSPPPDEELSRAEVSVLDDVFRRFGALSRWTLVELLHEQCPEWVDPEGSSIPIEYRDILAHVGVSQERAEEYLEELESRQLAESLFI